MNCIYCDVFAWHFHCYECLCIGSCLVIIHHASCRMSTNTTLTASRNCSRSLPGESKCVHMHSVCFSLIGFLIWVVITFCPVWKLVADGGLNEWFLCHLQSSISTYKTDAIQSIHYQSTTDAIRGGQQPLGVYQGQLKPIKPVRHHNACRRSDEASLECSAKWSYGHGAVSSTESSWGRVLKRLSSESKTL